MARLISTMTLILAFVGFVQAASPDPRSLIVSDADLAEARLLINKLNSAQFREREDASQRLNELGRKALIPLQNALDDPNPEISERVIDLYSRASIADMEARIETFLADTNDQYEHGLPGWFRFRSLDGDPVALRKLFTEVIRNRANLELLNALRGIHEERRLPLSAIAGPTALLDVETPPRGELLRALINRRVQLQLKIRPTGAVNAGYQVKYPSTPEMMLLMMAESLVPEDQVQFNAAQFSTQMYFFQATGRDALQGNGIYVPIFRNMTRRWLDTRVGMNGLSTAMNIASQNKYESDFILTLAVKMLRLPNSNSFYRSNAMGKIASLNGVQHLPLIRENFQDATVVSTVQNGGGRKVTQIQARDFALLMAVYLTKQEPSEYGFTLYPNQASTAKYAYNAGRFEEREDGITTEQKRATAFEKWTKWEVSTFGSVAGAIGPLAELHRSGGLLAPPKIEKAAER